MHLQVPPLEEIWRKKMFITIPLHIRLDAPASSTHGSNMKKNLLITIPLHIRLDAPASSTPGRNMKIEMFITISVHIRSDAPASSTPGKNMKKNMCITIQVHIRLDAPASSTPGSERMWTEMVIKKYEEKHVYHHSSPHTLRCTCKFYPWKRYEDRKF